MKVSIRPLTVKDAYTSVKWRNMSEIWKYTKFKADKEITIQDELTWIRKVTNDPSGRRFAILADGTYIGNIYLTDIHNNTAEYHIFIGEKTYWGKGIATQASKLILKYAKNTLRLKEVYLNVMKKNTSAYLVYKKLGFKESGEDGEFCKLTLKL